MTIAAMPTTHREMDADWTLTLSRTCVDLTLSLVALTPMR
jgi:hypothetical protein